MTNLGIDVCLFLNRSMEVLSSIYFFKFVQLSRLRSLVMKSQTTFVCGWLLSTLVTCVIQLWAMTLTDTVSLSHLFLVIFLSKPVIDLVYSSVDYTDKVNLSVFLIKLSSSKEYTSWQAHFK